MAGEAAETSKPAGDGQKLRVFLSYSRKDGEFLAKLAEALIALGYDASYDASPHGRNNPDLAISAEDDWWKQLEGMIAKADVMVFVVSPDSVQSKVCDEEIVYAQRLGKRVIPVLRRDVDFAKMPPKLATLNVKLRFTDDGEAAYAASLEELRHALDLDAPWWREQKWFAVQLKDWLDADAKNKTAWLLSAAEVERAERWAARRPPSAEAMTEAELDFLNASRENVALQARRRRRMQTAVLTLTVVALVITLAGGWYVIDRQRDVARSQSLMLARASQQMAERGDPVRAMRLAMLASRDTFLTPASDAAEFALASAAQGSEMEAELLGHTSRVFDAAVSANGARIVSWGEQNDVARWDVKTGRRLGDVTASPVGQLVSVAISPDGRRVALVGQQAVALMDVDSGKAIGGVIAHANVRNVVFSHDGKLFVIYGGAVAELRRSEDGSLVRGEGRSGLYSAAFSRDDKALLTGGKPGSVQLASLDGALICQMAPNETYEGSQAKFSPDGTKVLIEAYDAAQLWDVAECKPDGPVLRVQSGFHIEDAVISPDNNWVLGWGGDTTFNNRSYATLWDPKQEYGLQIRHAQDASIKGGAFAKDGKHIYTWASDGSFRRSEINAEPEMLSFLSQTGGVIPPEAATFMDEVITPLYAIRSGMLNGQAEEAPDGSELLVQGTDGQAGRISHRGATIGPVMRHLPEELRTDISPIKATYLDGGKRVLTWGPDKSLRIWRIGAAPEVKRVHYDFQPRLSADRKRLLVVADYDYDEGEDALVEIDIATFKPAGDWRLPVDGFADSKSVAYAPGGEWLAAPKDDAIWLWKGAPLAVEPVRKVAQGVDGLAFSPDGARLLWWREAPGEEGVVELHQVETATGKDVTTPAKRPAGSFGYTGDGLRIVVTSRLPADDKAGKAQSYENQVTLINAATGEAEGKPIKLSAFDPVALSGDGGRALVWRPQKFEDRANASEVAVWDTATGKTVFPPRPYPDGLNLAALTRDMKGIVVVAQDRRGTIEVIDAGTGEVKRHLEIGNQIGPVAVSEESGWVVAVSAGVAYAWRPEDGARASFTVGPVVREVMLLDGGRLAMVSPTLEGAQLFDIATGAKAGPALPVTDYDDARVWLAADRGAGLYLDGSTYLRRAPLDWFRRREGLAELRAEVCAQKLAAPDGAAGVGPRTIDAIDTAAAPVLNGREGEDACGWEPAWHDRVLDAVFGWMR